MVQKKLRDLMYSIGSSPHLKFFKRVPHYKKIYEALVLNPLSLPSVYSCMREIRRKGRMGGIEALLDFSYSCCDGFIKPGQVRGEIASLLELLKENPPRRMMEIGTSNGGTLFLFCNAARKDATVISLDLDGYPAARLPLYRSFASKGQRLHLLQGDSHSLSSLGKVKGLLSGGKLDLLFIDGDHSYGGVKRDFEMYSPLVRPGGIVAFHDINPHPPELKCEVSRFWGELKKTRKTKELVTDRAQGWAGIGLVFI